MLVTLPSSKGASQDTKVCSPDTKDASQGGRSDKYADTADRNLQPA